LLKVN